MNTDVSTRKYKENAANSDDLNMTQVQTASLSDWLDLTKPRLSSMSVLTALFGYLAAPSAADPLTFLSLLFGTALAAGGAAAYNQWWEREEDAKMERTTDRSIPSGKITPNDARILATLLSTAGIGILLVGTNLLCSLIIALTIALYVMVYTPLKKITPLNTLVGAVPGAIPPLAGWVAAENEFSLVGLLLFAILFLWQMPHFMAISWVHREDYARGGFRMLSYYDPSGRRVAFHSLIYTLILTGVAMFPVYLFNAGIVYWLPALALNGVLLYLAYNFWRKKERLPCAKLLFFATLVYLPLFLSFFVVGLRLYAV